MLGRPSEELVLIRCEASDRWPKSVESNFMIELRIANGARRFTDKTIRLFLSRSRPLDRPSVNSFRVPDFPPIRAAEPSAKFSSSSLRVGRLRDESRLLTDDNLERRSVSRPSTASNATAAGFDGPDTLVDVPYLVDTSEAWLLSALYRNTG